MSVMGRDMMDYIGRSGKLWTSLHQTPLLKVSVKGISGSLEKSLWDPDYPIIEPPAATWTQEDFLQGFITGVMEER